MGNINVCKVSCKWFLYPFYCAWTIKSNWCLISWQKSHRFSLCESYSCRIQLVTKASHVRLLSTTDRNTFLWICSLGTDLFQSLQWVLGDKWSYSPTVTLWLCEIAIKFLHVKWLNASILVKLAKSNQQQHSSDVIQDTGLGSLISTYYRCGRGEQSHQYLEILFNLKPSKLVTYCFVYCFQFCDLKMSCKLLLLWIG